MNVFDFAPELGPKNVESGFDMGCLVIQCANGKPCGKQVMIVVTATQLLDEIEYFLKEEKLDTYRFDSTSTTFPVYFKKERPGMVVVSCDTDKKSVGTFPWREVIQDLKRATESFHRRFVRHLPTSDAARQTYEMAANSFAKLLTGSTRD